MEDRASKTADNWAKREARLAAYNHTKINPAHMVCVQCGHKFLSGVMIIERSFIVGAKCTQCVPMEAAKTTARK